MKQAFRLALRDLRGRQAGALLVMACLALGVGAIAAVGGLRAAVDRGLAAHGREILGGDLELSSGYRPLPPALPDWLHAHGARTASVQLLRTLLSTSGGATLLVDLKVVDPAWPLVGSVKYAGNAAPLATGLAADPLVLERLGLNIGDKVRIGTLDLPIAGAIGNEPDRAANSALFGPRVLLAEAELPRTGLIVPGAMVEHTLRAVFPRGTDLGAVTGALQAAFPGNQVHVRTAQQAVPGFADTLDRLAAFLSLAGLASLLIGGIGVATGVRTWLESRAQTLAVLRCLGAGAATVFLVAFIEVAALALAGVSAGLVLGAALPALLIRLFGDALPVPAAQGVYFRPLAAAALAGALTALAASLPPLAMVPRIRPSALFRSSVLPPRARPPAWLYAAEVPLGLGLAALAARLSPGPRFAAGFMVASILVLGLFRLGGALLAVAARKVAPAMPPAVRLGLGFIWRPGNATALLATALGLGLSALTAISLIEANLDRDLGLRLTATAPSFYFIDIQPNQLDRFLTLAGGTAGVSRIDHLPYIASRVVAVNGIPAERLHPSPQTAWALRGGRGLALTFAAAPPAGTDLVAGAWWPKTYAGPPLLSFDADLAHGWGVKIGDTLTVDVLGRDVTLRVASLRHISWQSLSMNFAMVASPGLLTAAPHTELATLRAVPAAEAPLLRRIAGALPNVTPIRVADIVATVVRLLGQVSAAIGGAGWMTIAAGALVMAGAVAAGQRRRRQDAAILRSLGVSRAQIRGAFLTQFAVIGLGAGAAAAAIGSAASYSVMHLVLRADWTALPGRVALTLLLCLVTMLVLGYAGTEADVRARPAARLRAD